MNTTNKGVVYPFGGAAIRGFCGSPSPHLTPSKLPVLSEKKI